MFQLKFGKCWYVAFDPPAHFRVLLTFLRSEAKVIHAKGSAESIREVLRKDYGLEFEVVKLTDAELEAQRK